MTYTFGNEKFTLVEKPLNRTSIRLTEIQEQETSWFLKEETLVETMKLILIGAHDKISWLDQPQVETLRAYRDFFRNVAKKANELSE